MSGRNYVLWADYIDHRYKVGMTDARYKPPFGVEVITVVDDTELHIMRRYIKKRLSCGWTPKMCRDACEVV